MKGIDAAAEDWARIAATNIAGPALCAKYTVPEMRKVGGGAIVNICSISALIAQGEYLTYSATKGALLTMTRCMALDLARDKIRVNAVSPGTVWTEANARFIKQVYGLDRAGADKHPEVGGQHLFERTADPEEIASVVAFLASAEASFMTGENVVVDAGYTIR
jgi:dihydroanticapsin dehydrogenase